MTTLYMITESLRFGNMMTHMLQNSIFIHSKRVNKYLYFPSNDRWAKRPRGFVSIEFLTTMSTFELIRMITL